VSGTTITRPQRIHVSLALRKRDHPPTRIYQSCVASVFPSAGLSAGPSVRPSVCPSDGAS